MHSLKSMRIRRIGQVAARHLLVLALGIVLLFPIYWMVVTSFLPRGNVLRYPPTFIPLDGTLNAYEYVLFEQPLLQWLRNSAIVVVISIVLSMVIAVLGGYALSRYPSKFTSFIGYSLLATRMITPTLLVIPLYLIFRSWNLLNTQLGLIIAYTTFQAPFATWMMKGYFDSIPRDLEEAAQVDGSSVTGAMIRISLPLSLPGVAASTMASAILGWSDYVFARTLMSKTSLWTVTVGIQSFLGEHVIQWSHIMVASLLSTIPVVLFFLAMERFMVMGLTSGAVK